MSISDFSAAVNVLLQLEGVLSNDPKDKGGLTKYGISQAAYPGRNIADLTIDEAKDIYRADYWDKCRCDDLPAALRFPVFQAAVLHGQGTAAQYLQAALGCVQDGVIGPTTIFVAEKASYPNNVLADFMSRCVFAESHASIWEQDGRGWVRRMFLTTLLSVSA